MSVDQGVTLGFIWELGGSDVQMKSENLGGLQMDLGLYEADDVTERVSGFCLAWKTAKMRG